MRAVFGCLMAVGATLAAFAVSSEGICVRNAEDARTWQVNLSPNEPIVWAWGAADSAVLTVASAVEKTSRSYAVARTEGDAFGSCAISLPTDVATVEHLLNLTLTLKSGETTLETRSARVAYLPNAFAVVQPGSGDWKRMDRPRVFAYDAAWTDGTPTSAKLTLAAGSASSTVSLDGLLGYAALDPATQLTGFERGAFVATLVFDETSFATASLKSGVHGMAILIR